MNTYYPASVSGSPFVPFSSAETSLYEIVKNQSRSGYIMTSKLLRPQTPIASSGWGFWPPRPLSRIFKTFSSLAYPFKILRTLLVRQVSGGNLT